MKKIYLFYFLFPFTFGFGQTPKLSPDEAKADVQYLYTLFKSKHPNLYLYSAKEEIEAFFTGLLMLNDSISKVEFYNRITTVSEKIKDGHTLFFPEAIDPTLPKYLFFPCKLFCKDRRLYIEADFSRYSTLEAGLEILSINQVKTQEVIDHFCSRLMRDGENLNYPIWIMNNYFSEYYSYFFGHPKQYTLEVKTKDGLQKVVTIPGLLKSEIRQNRSSRYGNQFKARGLNQTEKEGIVLKIDEQAKTAILSIRDFDSEILKNVYHQRFSKEIQQVFQRIAAEQIAHLIIDLRGNQGGNLAYGINLLSHLLPKEFSAVEKFGVVKNAESSSYAERIKPSFTRKGAGIQHSKSNVFKGEVFLMIDGGSFSNSAIVSAAFQHYQRGKIIGEESGGNRRVICGDAEWLTLPHSRINVAMPVRQYVLRDLEKNDGHGVIPDYLISPSIEDLITGKDRVLEFVLGLIKK